uniref:Myb/SANT-like domain-containing protein n=1 Tax=Hordeum vulgare subsp. vulgare TaxID=112509 RepID=A0A8I6X4D0_HORVV
MAGRSFAALFQDSQGADEEEDLFGDGSQVGNYSPPIRAAAAPFRAPAAGGFSPRVGCLGAAIGGLGAAATGGLGAAATGGLGASTGGLGAAPTFLDPPAPGGLDLNSEAAALSEYQHVLQPQEAPPRRRSGKHVVATAGRGRGAGRGAGGRRTSSSAGMPPRPARSGAGRGGGVVKRGRSLTNAASAQTGGHIDLDDDEEGFYCTNFNMLQNSDEEEDDSDERGFDNAKWNEPRLELFLKLVIREISDGNRPNNQMAPVGWKNICRDFRRSCGQKYNVKAMKNRYTQAKVLATFWKEVLVKSSGLGRGPNGEILASESWWQANTKGRTECYRVFKDRVPPYLDDLMLIFDNVTVDGASAFCPGFDEEDNQPSNGVAADLCDGTREDDTCSPMGSANKRASSSSKRASSIGYTGESPSKKTKSPMVKALRGLVNEIKIDREEGKKKEDNYAKREEARSRAMVNAQAQIMVQKRQAIQEEMDQCVALAKECGVAEASVEMWVASELFMDANKRAFFRAMQTLEARLAWIQMHCEQRGIVIKK